MPQRLVQTAVLGERARQLERGPQGCEHALGGERLLEELERAQLGGAHGVGEVRLAAHHDHREVRCAALELLERLQAVGPARHHQVEQHRVGRLALDRRDRGGPIGGLGGLEALRLQQRPHHLADVGLVVHEQDARAHGVASTMANVAPPPVVSETRIVPLWDSIVCRTSASPRPVPSCLVVKYGSNTRGRSSSGMPHPWSAIVTSRPRPSFATATSIEPRPPIASAALRSRFAKARRSGSYWPSIVRGAPLARTVTATSGGTALLLRSTSKSTRSTSLFGPSGNRPNSANSFARRSRRSVSAESTSTATAVCAPERRT